MVAAALIGAGASILGGIFGRKSEKKAAARNRANEIEDARVKFQRLRESAQLGGFNPLTALQTTGGAGFSFSGGNVAPLASIQMITGGISDAAQALSSDAALRRKTDQLKYDLAKVQLDQIKADLKVANSVQRVASSMPSVGNQAKTTARKLVESGIQTEPQRPVQVGKDGVASTTETTQIHVNPDGETVHVPVGPDIDEIVSGTVIKYWPKIRTFYNTYVKTSEVLQRPYVPNPGSPVVVRRPTLSPVVQRGTTAPRYGNLENKYPFLKGN